jgi:hypothetical protein
MVRHGVELQINRFVGGGLHLDVHATNHFVAPANIELSWEFDADFADRAEAEQGERQQTGPVERRWNWETGQGKLSFNYRHPKLPHATEIRFSGSQDVTEHDGTASLSLRLQPQKPVSFGVDVVPIFCGEPVAPQHGPDAFGDPPIQRRAMARCNDHRQSAGAARLAAPSLTSPLWRCSKATAKSS